MRVFVVLAAVALIAIYAGIKLGMPAQSLKQNAGPSSADLKHPPTPIGAPAAIAAPENGKRPRDQSN